MSNDTKIRAMFEEADIARENFLQICRECAALTIPSILLPRGWTPDQRIQEAYQSIGADGLTSIVGKMLVALFTAPWFRYRPSPNVRVKAGADAWAQFDNLLYGRELQINSQLEATNYRVAFRQMLEQVIGVADGCVQVMDDYNMRSFRLNSWIPQRDASGQVIGVLVKERKRIAHLSEEKMAILGVSAADLAAMPDDKKIRDMYTFAEWQPMGRNWVIRQEISDKEISSSEEPCSPFIVAGYIELSDEDHARGFIEERIGDLRSHNGLSKALLDGYVALAMNRPLYDPSKGWTSEVFTRPNGVPCAGRVSGNLPDGLAFMRADKAGDLGGALAGLQQIESRLGKQMLMESAAQPTGERVTAYQVDRIRQELDGALGGVYANIAREIQVPLLKRIEYMMERDRKLVPIPKPYDKEVDVQALTGLEALGRQVTVSRLLSALQSVAQLPGAMEELNFRAVILEVFKAANVNVEQFLKTAEQKAAESQSKIDQQAALDANAAQAKMAGRIGEIAAQAQAQQ